MARAPFDEHYAGSPLAVCWFTNFSCNARCPFCCKAQEIRDGRDRFPPLSLEQAGELMARIRRTVDILYLSGGEPLIHPHIVEILQEARRLEFAAVGMSTNLITLDRRPEVLDYLDAISVSIHSPDPAIHAASLAVPVETAQRVFANLELIKQHPRRPVFKAIMNCVINPTNLGTVPAMIDFTRRHGFLLELVPANEHNRAPAGLKGNPAYEATIDRILALRRSGQARHLAGSSSYYRRIRSFEPFRCFPYGVPNIMPDGRLCTPCDVSEQYAVNVLDYADLKSAVAASLPHLGHYPCRQGHCFKAGILERSRLFNLLGRKVR
jgi:MoaA/NifB/PqqE/SkfB family radical SAM enzyme